MVSVTNSLECGGQAALFSAQPRKSAIGATSGEDHVHMSEQTRHELVTRRELESILERWQRNELDERTAHDAAERLWERFGGEPPTYPENDDRSIGMEVLAQLEVLNHQLITPADIPAFLEFLHARRGEERAAWDEWRLYWKAIDYKRRAKELAGNPYYAPLP